MKRKITWPVVLTLIIVGFIVSVELILLFNRMALTVENGTWTEDAFKYIIYRIIMEISVLGIILYIKLVRSINKVTGPITQLTKDVRNFNLDSYMYPTRDYEVEEIQELALAFDYMEDELGSNIRKLKHQKEKLETTLEALEEGIVVLNKKGYIDQVNELARHMLKLPSNVETKFVNIVNNEQIRRIVEEGLKNGGYPITEINLEEKIIFFNLVAVGNVKNAYEYLLVMRDVTQLRKLEEMRSQFVSNVSHEIKTPLTSIQGFVETLQSGALENPEVAHKFLNIIDIETKRLYRIIQDILSLSEIESMETFEYDTVNINKLIEETITLVSRQAEEKGIKIYFDEEESLQVKNISEDHLKQLFMNLISNAIRYTDHGEVTVKINKESVLISDTGIGIPEESIPHIFERFYRVDKSRSRQSGGTGLGLSIVKHIAKLYNIEVDVQSKLAQGSIFSLTIPSDKIVRV